MKKLVLSLLCLIQVQSALSSATLGFVIAELMRGSKPIAVADVVTLVPYASLAETQKAAIKKLYVDDELAADDCGSRSSAIEKEQDFEQWVAGDSFSLDVIQVNGFIVGGFISDNRESYIFIHRLFLVPEYEKSRCAQQAVQLFETTHKYPVLKVKGDMDTVSFWHTCGFSESQDPYAQLFELEKNLLSPVHHQITNQVDRQHAPQPQGFHLYLANMNFFKILKRANLADVTFQVVSSKTVYEKDDKYDVFYKNECVGSVSYTVVPGLQGSCITVSNLHINEKERKRGLGKCVILRLEQDYAPRQIVAANVFSSARDFWQKCGFKPSGDASGLHYIKQCGDHRS